MNMIPKPVIVCTEGVELLFGTMVSRDDERRAVTLSDARILLDHPDVEEMCYLAASGPTTRDYNISKILLRVEIYKVTCIIDVTDDVANVWMNHDKE